MCVECEDTRAILRCVACVNTYCELCFQAQHRKGSRKQHESESLEQTSPRSINFVQQVFAVEPKQQKDISTTQVDALVNLVVEGSPSAPTLSAKYIPLRLSAEERQFFILLDASLRVSEYTDNVDILCHRSSTTRRVLKELSELFSIMSGMLVTNNFHKGKRMVQGHKIMENAEFLQRVFEIGRRYKIMNPEKMRDNYGKMIHLLQDSSGKEIRRHLEFSCVSPIQTVHSFLESKEALDILNDPLFAVATQAIVTEGQRHEIENQVRQKQQAFSSICEKYTSDTLSKEDISNCLASVDDSITYVEQKCRPILKMIEYLESYFNPRAPESKSLSLGISAGRNGSRLTHSHSTQYYYVLQSLHLWDRVTRNMPALWFAAEDDLLSGTSQYRLRDTGQGLNRVQRAPNTSRLMHKILSDVKATTEGWIGSSVIHLGDHNVPNALTFIDKYCCVSRMLNPIVKTIEEVDALQQDAKTGEYIRNTFGSAEDLRRVILCDFFKHGFDGSGADNFIDAGSCVDGRTTSAWNWCSKIEKKSFYHLFLLAGFVGFDGGF